MNIDHYRRQYETVLATVAQTGNRRSAMYAGHLLCLLLEPQIEGEHSLVITSGLCHIRGREYPPAMRADGRPMWRLAPHVDVVAREEEHEQNGSFQVTVWIRVENLCSFETVATRSEAEALEAVRACVRHCEGSAWLGGSPRR